MRILGNISNKGKKIFKVLIYLMVLVIFILSGCFYVPKVAERQDSTCELITKSLTLENIGTADNYPSGCKDKCVLFAMGVTASSVIVSGSVVAVGNTIHWIEKQGRCEDRMIKERINQLYEKSVAAGGFILKTNENLMKWLNSKK